MIKLNNKKYYVYIYINAHFNVEIVNYLHTLIYYTFVFLLLHGGLFILDIEIFHLNLDFNYHYTHIKYPQKFQALTPIHHYNTNLIDLNLIK
jgi:hypothetical protein